MVQGLYSDDGLKFLNEKIDSEGVVSNMQDMGST